jgi:methylphosphotriester-DNA--protein-cysteine methyltransferase
MERCPACRARLNNSVVCKRCDCDLTLVFAAQDQSEKALQQAIQALSHNQSEQACQQVTQALQLDVTVLAILVNKYLQHYPPPARQASSTIVETMISRVGQSLKHVQRTLLKHHA